MPIISVRDNKNNSWKKNARKTRTNKETNKDGKEQKRKEIMVIGWELNDFVVRLS